MALEIKRSVKTLSLSLQPSDRAPQQQPNSSRGAQQLFETAPPWHLLPPTSALPGTLLLSLQEHEVRRRLRAVKPRRAASPSSIPVVVLEACVHQLAVILTSLFNLSDSCHCSHPSEDCNRQLPWLQTTTALMSVLMKCFEQICVSTSETAYHPLLTPTNLLTEQIGPRRMASPSPSGEKEELRENAIHGLQLTV